MFIPYTIPGEIVEARITGEKGRVRFAEGLQLIDASADRVFPRCPHFGPRRCGRCQWQHIAEHAQPLIKQDVLADQLARIGGFDDADVRPIIPAPAQWGYNHHMLMAVAPEGQLGFHAAPPLTEGVMPIDECHIMKPELLNLIERLDLDFTGVPRIQVQIDSDDNLMLVLWVADEDDAPELATDMAMSVNLILPDNEPINLIGDASSRFDVGPHSFRVTVGSAFRANIGRIDALANLVLQALDLPEDAAVLDLYAGVGVFSAYIAPHASIVTMVESFPPAATDAEENLPMDNVDIVEGTVEEVLAGIDGDYDAAVIDPPSEGLSIEAVDALAEVGVPRLVYVSSDPATLARDVKRLARQGYELGVVYPIDLNPQTYYVDAVAILTRINDA